MVRRLRPDGDEWYTPAWLFDQLGVHFDVDPCSPRDPTLSNVPADVRYTLDDDGLTQPWRGTVWCNPPYSGVGPWVERMIAHGVEALARIDPNGEARYEGRRVASPPWQRAQTRRAQGEHR